MRDFAVVQRDCRKLVARLEGVGLHAAASALREMVGTAGSISGSLFGLRHVLGNIRGRIAASHPEIEWEIGQLLVDIERNIGTLER